jgi:hypothetical protein
MIKGIRPSLAEAGAIKIGRLGDEKTSKKTGKKFRQPMKLDHFLVTNKMRGNDENFQVNEPLMEALKTGWADSDGHVRSIPIMLHSDVIDEVFPTNYAIYAGKKVACTGDGENAIQWAFKGKQRLDKNRKIKCPCKELTENRCKPHGKLYCSIALPNHAVAGAVFVWRTTGIISIQRMIGSLEQILATVGTLVHIPLVLKVQPVQVTPGGRTQTVYACHVELRAKDIVAVQKQALAARESRKLLNPPQIEMSELVRAPGSADEPEEEQEAVEAEFYPENGSEQSQPQQSTTQSVKNAAKETAQQEPPPQSDDDEPDYGEPDDS